jgi:hypothetical protein
MKLRNETHRRLFVSVDTGCDNGNDNGGDNNNDNSHDDEFNEIEIKIGYKVLCVENLFGNANFTKKKIYKIYPTKDDTYIINTNYEDCSLICNLQNNKATDKEKNICFGLCLFVIKETFVVFVKKE